MKSRRTLVLLGGLLLILSWMPMGCGGGGGNGNGPVTLTPNLVVDQAAYDFGSVTVGKTATLQVMVHNTGTADLSVNDLAISDLVNFSIDSGSCGLAPYTITAGGDCTVFVTFTPTEVGLFDETLVVSSNDGDAPSYSIALTGEGTEATALNVTLNQIDTVACPTTTISAYVAVTDQNGFLVDGLLDTDLFKITENGGTAFPPDSVYFAQTAALSMAAAIVMDYSFSVTEDPTFVSAMENGATAFVDQMGANDLGEIIKFGETVSVVQPFTGDKDLLRAAIPGLPGLGKLTALYDAMYQGIEDAAATTTHRRAVILLTDGVDYGGSATTPGSVHTLDDVITLARTEGVPVFTIGVGPDVDPDVLDEIAAETGGQYFDAPSTDRLITIYTQLSEILNNQYVLTYSTSFTGTGADVVVDVAVVDQPGITGNISGPLSYIGCP